METPNLDSLINDLETYDRMDMLSDSGRNQLNEYKSVKRAVLRIHDIVGQSEQLKAFADYAQKRIWEDGDKDLSEFVDEFLST